MRERELMFLFPTRQAEEREQLVSFLELTAEHDKVKTSVENEQRICKEKKVYEWIIMLEPGKNSKSVSAHFFSLGYDAYNCLVDSRLMLQYALSFSRQLLDT